MKKKRTKKSKLIRNMAKGKGNLAKKQSQNARSDSAWETFVKNFWRPLIQRVLPHLYAELDLTKQPEFLSREFLGPLPHVKEMHLPNLVEESWRLLLKETVLLKFYMKDQGERLVYLHLEYPGQGAGDVINYRMAFYTALVIRCYNMLPETLGILTVPRPLEEQDVVGNLKTQTGASSFTYHFDALELYKLDDDELLNSDSPIDIAFYAAKKAGTEPTEVKKFTYLKTLTRVLAKQNWTDAERREIFRFAAHIINLTDEQLQNQYRAEIRAEDETKEMESLVEKYFNEVHKGVA